MELFKIYFIKNQHIIIAFLKRIVQAFSFLFKNARYDIITILAQIHISKYILTNLYVWAA